MAKKKKKPSPKALVAFSDKSYILQDKARKLPISKCLINEGWGDDGLADIYVFRKHSNGNVTIGIYLVDLLCAGLKDTFYRFSQDEAFFEYTLKQTPVALEECSYELAHNIIYGGIAYAEEFGIEPHPDFRITQHLLEEDTDAIPLMELEFGKEGKALLMLRPDDPRGAYYKRQLQTYAAPGEYEIIEGPDLDMLHNPFDDEFAHPEAWTRQEWEDFIDETEPDQLYGFPEAMAMIYEKLIVLPKQAKEIRTTETKMQEMEISFDALDPSPTRMGAEEAKELVEVAKIINGPTFTQSTYQKVVERLKQGIARWPYNPVFYTQLIGAHDRIDNIELADQTIEELYARFPDYLFAKTHYADLLLAREELDKIPEVFNDQYTLAGLYPDRKTFHISELMEHGAIMCCYFVRKKDLQRAFIYGKLLREVGLELQNDMTLVALELLNDAIQEEVEPVFTKARQDHIYRQKLLSQLGYEHT